LEFDPQRELKLRRSNSPEEAQQLNPKVLDKLEKGLLENDLGPEDVKLLIIYLSYKGE
jgi:hypothetical protein